MRLLFLTPQLPYPPRQGTAIRNWGLIAGLSANHEITLLTFADTPDVPEPLARACRKVITVPRPRRPMSARVRTLLSPYPDLATRLASQEFENTLGTLLAQEEFEAVQMEGLEMATHVIPAPMAARPTRRVRLIYDAHNAETQLQRRALTADARTPTRWLAALYSALQIQRLARFEANVCRRADHVLCVSREDARALQWLVRGLSPTIVPNGINLAEYRDWATTSAEDRRPPLLSYAAGQKAAGKAALVLTGKMDYRPNVDAVLWFAAEILPKVQARVPEAVFVVVGQRPLRSLERLGKRPGIVVTGEVEDTQPFIAQAMVYVAPLRMGGGTRFKLLEAMALRKAIVSTALGAEGFDVVHGREMALADAPDQFAAEVVRLLRDEAARIEMGRAARAFVEDYDWKRIIPNLEAVLREVGTSGRGAG